MEIYFFIGAVALVLITRRFSRIAGGAVGMAVAVAIGIWGVMTFADGRGVAFAGFPVSREVFLLLVGAWFCVEGYGLWQAVRAGRD